jgi:replicative DNA helicase
MEKLANRRIEEDVLGVCIMDTKKLHEVRSLLLPDAFYFKETKVAYEKCLSLTDMGLKCDLMCLCTALDSDNVDYDKAWLENICNVYIGSSRLESWCKMLMLLRARRIIHEQGMKLARDIRTMEDVEVVTRTAMKNCNDALEMCMHKQACSTKENIIESLKFIEEISTNPDKHIVRYCVPGMDKEIHHSRKQIHVVGASPNTGKTGFALSILEAQIKEGIKHCIFCHETPTVQLNNRLLIMRAGLKSTDIYEIDAPKMARLGNASKGLMEQSENYRIYGSGDYEHSVDGIWSAVESMIESGFKPDMITVDYIQNMRPSLAMAKAQRSTQIEHMVLELSRMFKELNIAGLWLSQPNRDKNRDSTGKEFINADLKGSSAIEQEADFITYLQREPVKDVNYQTNLVNLKWYSSKIRDGHTIDCILAFNTDNGSVVQVKSRYEDYNGN